MAAILTNSDRMMIELLVMFAKHDRALATDLDHEETTIGELVPGRARQNDSRLLVRFTSNCDPRTLAESDSRATGTIERLHSASLTYNRSNARLTNEATSSDREGC
jgi:hypothetical protein